jgi:hypothetical protein
MRKRCNFVNSFNVITNRFTRASSIRGPIACILLLACVSAAGTSEAQIQVDLKFKRLQYIAYEPVVATISITNLAGRDIDLHDADGQSWLGFEITGSDGQTIAPMTAERGQSPLKIQAGQRVTHQFNLTPVYPVHDLGTYHVRTNVYFADLGKFFYSPTRVFEVADARPIWQQTVGIPDGVGLSGNVRTYALLTNRFPDHTSLYVRVQDKDSGFVYATYSLGREIAFEEPQVEIDHANQLHVLHCSAPRAWAYSRIGLNGELLAHSSYMETKTRPKLVRSGKGEVAVRGGTIEAPAAVQRSRGTAPKLSARPPEGPKDD